MKRIRAICAMTVFAILGTIAPAAWFGGADSDALAYDISNCQQDTPGKVYFDEKCPTPFDSNNPRTIWKQLRNQGIACRKPVNYGGDRFGGTYLKCQVEGSTLIIRAYPNSSAARSAKDTMNRDWVVREFRQFKWYGCSSVQLIGIRYRVELWDYRQQVLRDTHGTIVDAIHSALGIPKPSIYDRTTGTPAGTQYLTREPNVAKPSTKYSQACDGWYD